MYDEKFDSKKELGRLSIDRLFVFQKMCLKDIRSYLVGNTLYDKNDLYNSLQYLEVINFIITKKISENKKLYK